MTFWKKLLYQKAWKDEQPLLSLCRVQVFVDLLNLQRFELFTQEIKDYLSFSSFMVKKPPSKGYFINVTLVFQNFF